MRSSWFRDGRGTQAMGWRKIKSLGGLRGKLTLSILVLGVFPLVLGMVVAYLQGTRELQEISGNSFAGIAGETARKLDSVVSEEIARTMRITGDPAVIKVLDVRHRRNIGLMVPGVLQRSEKSWNAGDPAKLRSILDSPLSARLKKFYSEQYPDPPPFSSGSPRIPTRSLFLTDSRGELVASLSREVPYLGGETDWWKGAYHNGQGEIFLENLYFDPLLNTYAFSLSVPVQDKIHHRTVGVLHRILDARDYLDPLISPIRFGKTGHVMLIDGEGTVMSCPLLPTGTRLTDRRLISLVTQPRGGWVKAPSDGHGGEGTTSVVGSAPLFQTNRITHKSTQGGWFTYVWQSTDELFLPTRRLFTWISALGLIGIGLLGSMGYLAASRIVKPIRRLQEGALLIGQGKFQESIRIRTGDEIEQLADEFNRMNARLQRIFSGLENKVQEGVQEVQLLQAYHEQILQSVPNPIFLFGPDEQIDYVNRAAREFLNLYSGDPMGSKLFDILRTDEPARRKIREELRQQIRDPENPKTPILTAPIEIRPARDPLAHPTLSQAGATSLNKKIRIGPSTYQYELFHIRGQFGKKETMGLVLRDATEETWLQDQIIQMERLAGLDVLIAGIGHELNNPLYGIMGLGEAIQEDQDISRMKDHVRGILENAGRMTALIRDFTGQVRPERSGEDVRVDIHQQLDQVLKLLGLSDAPEGIEVQRAYQPAPAVLAWPADVLQVFANVIKNAVQAMKGNGLIRISTEVADGTVRVRIRDSGPGIPRHLVPRIFDPFFTTKGPGQGTGLGLTIAHRIMTRYGGHIRIETDEGEGTTVCLIFPIPEPAAFLAVSDPGSA
ncbi:MAG: HAMP domain-containing protein [Nitrospirae bacterium]|nr:HAMP domain-containing protein [Nitrospirota bacterium]